MEEEPGEPFDFVIGTQGKFFDMADELLIDVFRPFYHGDNMKRCESIKLSGNSFGIDACQWIAENFL